MILDRAMDARAEMRTGRAAAPVPDVRAAAMLAALRAAGIELTTAQLSALGAALEEGKDPPTGTDGP